MWIRSQNRCFLGNICGIELMKDGIIGGKENCVYTLVGHGHASIKTLGTYDTKGRAIEVLNEIQRQLVINNTRYTVNEIQRSSAGYVDIDKEEHVYQMPEK